MPLRYAAASLPRAGQTESVVERLAEQLLFEGGRRPSPSERKSWHRSLPVLAEDLAEAGLGDVEVLLEYQLPLTSQRADVVLAGTHPETGRPSYVVVELKQWSSARLWEHDQNLVEVDGMPGGPKTHPIKQVRGYATYITDFVRTLDGDGDAVAGVAYLHNATAPTAVAELYELPGDLHGTMFTGADRHAFHRFLRTRLDTRAGSGVAAGDRLLNSAAAPSQQLLAVAAAEVQTREQFVLQGNQQLAVDLVHHEVERARRADTKSVVIVIGGPGSGKSVVALSLLGDLSREGRRVLHATGSRSFTMTLRKVAGSRNPRVQRMFKYFNQFMDADRNDLDVLILDAPTRGVPVTAADVVTAELETLEGRVRRAAPALAHLLPRVRHDQCRVQRRPGRLGEAHRLRETSVNRYTTAQFRTGRLQVDELMSAARVPVFLLDEHQVVRPGEMGSVAAIEQYAAQQGFRVHKVSLPEQYRCGGSATYVRWVERLLGLVDGQVETLPAEDRFQVEVVDSPEEMECVLAAKITDGYSARMAAGYCWPWSDPTTDGRLVPDVRIGSWARPWNTKGDKRVGDAPPAALWATDQGGFGQVGCVYTAQGFEYDWSGVILGPDLVWRGGRFVSRRAENRDPDFRSRTTVSDGQFDHLVRAVYKVLLTRGMVGTVLYSTDAETRQALSDLVGRTQPFVGM